MAARTARTERLREPEGFRHVAPGASESAPEHVSAERRSHDRWVINKLRALGAYYTKGVEGGAELRAGLNTTSSLDELRSLIARFFLMERTREA